MSRDASRRLASRIAALAAVTVAALAHTASASHAASELLRLSGGMRVKVVWQRLVGSHPSRGIMKLTGGNSSLVVLDTDEGSERVLVPGPTSCYSPLITAEGTHVVYYDEARSASFCVAWDGTGRRALGSEQITGVWGDPETGTSYVFYGSPLMRAPLDDLSKAQRVFERGGRVTLSADGTRAGGLATHPLCGVADLTTGGFKGFARGCWGMISPDNSYRFFHLDGPHKTIYMYDAGGGNRRKIRANTMPGVDGKYDVYAPRWSNHPRFMTIAGPIGITSGSKNVKPTQTDVYVGMFDEQYSRIAAWVNLSPGDTFETHAHAWFETPDARRVAGSDTKKDEKKGVAASQQGAQATADDAAARSLAAAEAALARNDHAKAFELFTFVTQRYAHTESAKTAAERLASIRADRAAMKKVNDERAAKKCRGMLSMARSYARNGMTARARALLEKVVDEFPDTSFAEEARRELNDLR